MVDRCAADDFGGAVLVLADVACARSGRVDNDVAVSANVINEDLISTTDTRPSRVALPTERDVIA